MSLKSNTVIIVEGKTDTIKLKKIFPNIETIETNGFAINSEIISLIKQTMKTSDVICFLDPDGPGKRIRQTIINEIPNIKHAFIDIELLRNKKKIGVAEADDKDIIAALDNLIEFKQKTDSISWEEYIDLGLNTKSKRQVVCDYYKIPLFNHKQLFNILNMMGITYQEVLKIQGDDNE